MIKFSFLWGNFLEIFPPEGNLYIWLTLLYNDVKREEFLKYLKDKAEIINKVEVLKRDIEVKITKRFIISIVGPRRAGKTYFFYYLAKSLGRDYIYINFEDSIMSDIKPRDILDFISYYEEFFGKKPEFLFFDEIQVIKGWEKPVRELFERRDHTIFVTGSSSKLLSKEIATQLRGRSIKYLLLPLSFGEFLRFNKVKLEYPFSTSEENKLKNFFLKYLKNGGFPDVVLEEGIFWKFFEEYIDLVIYKDIAERWRIRNLFLLKNMIKSVVSSISSKFSLHKFHKVLKSQGIKVSKKTVYSYFDYLKDSLFVFDLRKYSPSIRKSELTIPKIYLVDNGILKYFGIDDLGRCLENIIFLHLLRMKNQKPSLRIYYWEENGKEVDFLVIDGKGKTLINVTWELDEKNYEREVKSLIKVSKFFETEDLLIITYDQEEEIRENDKIIKVVPAWKFLLWGNLSKNFPPEGNQKSE